MTFVFERFTQDSRAVLTDAHDMAVELGSHYISVGHILYGCSQPKEATAGMALTYCGVTRASVRHLLPRAGGRAEAEQVDPDALRAIGIDYDGIRAAVEETFGAGALEAAPDRRASSLTKRTLPFSPDAKRSLGLSLRVAVELHQKIILPGHILLGLLRLDDSVVSSVLRTSGTTVAGLSGATLSRLAAVA